MMVIAMLLCVPAMADSPAVGYWLVERSSLTNAVNLAGGLARVEESVLDEMADCHGHFNGSCDLWLHARTVQFRLKATDDGKRVDYSISLSRPQVKEPPRSSTGRIDVGQEFVAKDGWEKDPVVLVLKRLNLKR
jgi:hypothetical protein